MNHRLSESTESEDFPLRVGTGWSYCCQGLFWPIMVEREDRDRNLDSERRLALRQARSRPILDDTHAYLEREQPKVLPKSPEGQAIAYALSNWKALIRYCEDGDLEIDNNGADRSLRGIAVGRNYRRF